MTLLAPPEKDRSAQHRRAPWVALVLLIALAVTLAGIFPFRQIIAQQRQVDLAEEKLAALMEENRGLEERIELLQTPTEVERLAREQFGVVREGEIAYTVVTPEQERSAAGGRVAVPHPLEERTLLQRVWDFLTGRDLVDDG